MNSRALLTFILAGACLLASAATPSGGSDRLRQLVRLPQISMSVEFLGYTADEGFSALLDAGECRAELARLEQEAGSLENAGGRLLRMAWLYQRLGAAAKARPALEEAIAHLRRRTEAEPENGLLLARLGGAIAQQGGRAEAESLLRRAVAQAPREAEVQVALGGFLLGRSISALMGTDALPANTPALSVNLLGRVLERKPLAAEVEQSRQWMDEAIACFNTAVRLAPNEADLIARRGICYSFQNYTQEILRLAESIEEGTQEPNSIDVFGALFPDECARDFRRAAELDPRNPRRVTATAMVELVRAAHEAKRPAFGTPDTWSLLPETVRTAVRGDLERLLTLGESSDPRLAALASTCAGMLQFMAMNDLRGAVVSLRRAVALNPALESAWEMLFAVLVTQEKFTELLPLAEQRLKQEDTARNRVILAKVLEKLDRLDQARPHLETALQQAPKEMLPNLCMAALLLKVSRDGDDLMPAVTFLAKAGHAMGSSPQRNNLVDLQTLRALYYALSGKAAMARQILTRLIELDPGNDHAKEILSALGDVQEPR